MCGGDHPPEDHGLADGAGFRALDASGLRRLRAEALEELLHGLLGGMPTLAKPFNPNAIIRLAGVVLDRFRRPWGAH